jgi:hypothetical protein
MAKHFTHLYICFKLLELGNTVLKLKLYSLKSHYMLNLQIVETLKQEMQGCELQADLKLGNTN